MGEGLLQNHLMSVIVDPVKQNLKCQEEQGNSQAEEKYQAHCDD